LAGTCEGVIAVAAPIQRGGSWWQARLDGTWLRWDAEIQVWQEDAFPPPPPTEDPATFEARWLQADLEVFKMAVEHFERNLIMFWQHSVFFIAIQGALHSATGGGGPPWSLLELGGPPGVGGGDGDDYVVLPIVKELLK